MKEQFKRPQHDSSSSGEDQPFKSNPNNVCTTADCVTAASRLLQNMDQSVKPCDNFYQYACGGWLARHVIPETSSYHSVLDILGDKLEISLKGQLNWISDLYLHTQKAQLDMQLRCKCCVIDSNGSTTATKYKQGVFFLSFFAEERWSLEDTLAILTAHFHKKALLDMSVWMDDRDSMHHIIRIDQPGLGMPSRDLYFNDGNNQKVKQLKDKNLTQDDNQVLAEMMQVLELETEIANATSLVEERQDATTMYKKLKLSELSNKFTFNGFNWKQFVQGVLKSVPIDVHPEEEVVVYSSSYLEKMNDVLSKHSNRTLQNYLMWLLISDQVTSLSQRFKDARAGYKKALDGTTGETAWWRHCVRYVQGSMETAIGALYVREAFAGKSKLIVTDLIGEIKQAYIETLEELEWMDAPSKEKAREKVMAVKELIGYPDHILQENNEKLDEEYALLNFSEEQFFENTLENLKSEAHKNLKKLREPVDPNQWIIGAAVVNAFYSPNRNQIVFPAGILQPPLFSKHQPQALNFGGIGMVIGHEIMHGFDDNGRNFDKDGNMLNWWSNHSAEQFKEQSQCMVQQYGNFKWNLAGGQNVSGITTLGENIADNGGIRQAFRAYLKWVETRGEEEHLPGLDMNDKQLFFINFAQVWCGAYRPEYASQSIKTDSHSPLEYRVLGSLQNFEAFSEAFQCHKGSRMNPEQKCRVW
uniref:Membrane metallo-endopeptidase-like 1 n=1 Tax=Gouania willdenowi TaxID=441366 RepID=A0A8C5HI79_GOUWI